MAPILDLITKLAADEARLRERIFLAPCVQGGTIRTRVAGLVYTFAPRPAEFEGWGLFRPDDGDAAMLAREASAGVVDTYLRLFPALRLRLAFRLRGRSWMAFPVNESDMRQRFGTAGPVTVHLAERGEEMEGIVARFDGTAWWFESPDRRDDPVLADRLRAALASGDDPGWLRMKGLTPEMVIAYELALYRRVPFRHYPDRHHGENHGRPENGERRIRQVLERAGGRLERTYDRDDAWLLEWRTRDGQLHTSVVAKRDLTVISAGICLSGGDRQFDLHSLVGVVERRPDWMR